MESRATDRECLERQFLGEPDAGNPHVRFLEGGGFPPLLDWRFFESQSQSTQELPSDRLQPL